MSPRTPPKPPEICPVCGEDVPRKALACPECGADHNSGWRAQAESDDALGEAAEDFDYDEFVRKEFGRGVKPSGIHAVWWVTALLLILAIALAYFLR